jgi:phosphatidylglycerophosphate synthase
LCSLGLFAYQSLDAIDGKQARRTNSSTPLGELFDHGCDAVSTGLFIYIYLEKKSEKIFISFVCQVFVAIGCSAALGLGKSPWVLFLVCFFAMVTFYTAHWQTYVTGTLKFGTIDVTEAQLIIYSIYFLSGIFGVSMWSTEVTFNFYSISLINSNHYNNVCFNYLDSSLRH